MTDELDRLTPDSTTAGVFEIVFEDAVVLTVALSPGYPMVVQRFPVSGQEGHWLDRASAEFSSLPPFVVGEPVTLDDPRGRFQSAPIVWIVELDEE
ncbi:hypothetical protein E3N86_00070 [Cryobacterium sp. Hz7]|uniref:hypothetical protein n=1 Tax=Cryobacterium sp. Hz7 TaxID=1259166 RepID=UPI00106A89DC|nr:hypothetical protein [Cryobacterium sp. Hz7]TFB67205.1 hypothetical protein E3N86_00070 [Cryobacterium sp. Hz7]